MYAGSYGFISNDWSFPREGQEIDIQGDKRWYCQYKYKYKLISYKSEKNVINYRDYDFTFRTNVIIIIINGS